MAFPVFIDTCTVFGSVLNDLLLRLAEAGAFRPDDFLLDQLDLFPAMVLSTLEDLAAAYERPAHTVDQVLDKLAATVPKFAEAARAEL